jgi:hypothetical protein
MPLLPPPTEMLTAPALPAVAAAEPMETDPEEPELAVPELNTNKPLAPFAPALEEPIVIKPLVLAMPKPLRKPIAPPVWTVLCPEATVIEPPAPLLPTPTVMLTAPPLPPVAVLEPIEIDPLVPELDVPELNMSKPLAPLSPEFDVRIVIAPLVLARPWPLVMPMAPPVSTALSPDATVSNPPTPLLPVPTVMLTAPALPPTAAPEPTRIEPLDPELVVPELNDSRPLTPFVPALDVRIVMAPLDVLTPSPLVTPMAPPVL